MRRVGLAPGSRDTSNRMEIGYVEEDGRIRMDWLVVAEVEVVVALVGSEAC